MVEKLVVEQPDEYPSLQTQFFPQMNTIKVEVITLTNEPVAEENRQRPAKRQNLKDITPLHDNDFPLDYRKISIFPTTDEINTPVSVYRVLTAVESSSCGDAALILDRHFRLLREDMLAPMREELRVLLSTEVGAKKPHRMVKYDYPRAITVGTSNTTSFVEVQFGMPEKVLSRVKGMKRRREIDQFFEKEHGKRILANGSVLLFVAQNRVVNMGIVTSRRVKDFGPEIVERMVTVEPVLPNKNSNNSNNSNQNGKGNSHQQKGQQKGSNINNNAPPPPPVTKLAIDFPPQITMKIGVTFVDQALTQVLFRLQGGFASSNQCIAEYMVQANSTLFSYEPVLKCLQ
eukprot:gene46271-57704_t